MYNSKDIDWELIYMYLSGQCSEEERRKVQSWMENDTDAKELINSMCKVYHIKPPIDAPAAWVLFENKLSTDSENCPQEK